MFPRVLGVGGRGAVAVCLGSTARRGPVGGTEFNKVDLLLFCEMSSSEKPHAHGVSVAGPHPEPELVQPPLKSGQRWFESQTPQLLKSQWLVLASQLMCPGPPPTPHRRHCQS